MEGYKGRSRYYCNIIYGRFLISYYLGQSNRLTSAYGAAGSLLVILLWVYYSSIILYFEPYYKSICYQPGLQDLSK